MDVTLQICTSRASEYVHKKRKYYIEEGQRGNISANITYVT